MTKTLMPGDKFAAILRDPNGESMQIKASVDDEKTVQCAIDGSTASVRVYMVDGTMVAQYTEAFSIFATCTRIGMTFTQRDVTSMMALVMSVANETPGVFVIPSAVIESLAFTDPLF
jgi:hypothetical protein